MLWPVHTGDYSRRIRRLSPSATVAKTGDFRRIRRQIVAEIGDYSLGCEQDFRGLGSVITAPSVGSGAERSPQTRFGEILAAKSLW